MATTIQTSQPIQTQAAQNQNNQKKLKDTIDANDPNYRFVNFFDKNEASSYRIGAIGDPRQLNFTSTTYIPGNHDVSSCKLNATEIYNQINKTDYYASKNYTKNVLKKTEVRGGMERNGIINVDYFFNPSAIITDYDLKEPLIPVFRGTVSIELFGYMVAPVSGNYYLEIKPQFIKRINMAVAWIQDNAESSYRIDNRKYYYQGPKNENTPTYLAKGVFTPFRIHMIATGNISEFPFEIKCTIEKTYKVTDFYSLKPGKEKKQVVFSLTKDPNFPTKCSVYTEGNIEKYGINKKIWETGKATSDNQILAIRTWGPIESSADSVGLDESGNLVAFSGNTKIGQPIFVSGYASGTKGVNQFALNENPNDLIRLIRKNPYAQWNTIIGLLPNTSVGEFVGNPDWNNFSLRGAMDSSKRITSSNPLISSNGKLMLVLQSSRNGSAKELVLYASVKANTIFYGLNVDNKLGKTFYVNDNSNNQYLREVPVELTAYSDKSQFADYNNYYPQVNGTYTFGKTEDCRKECNSDPTCTHTYGVTDENGKKCLLSSGTPMYLLNPPQTGWSDSSPYKTSTLHVRGKTLDIKQMSDSSFSTIPQTMGTITGFNRYTMRLPLTSASGSRSNGEPEIINEQNKIKLTTSSNATLIKQDPYNKRAGYIAATRRQGFTGLNQSTLEGFQYSSAPNPLPAGKTIIQNISGQLIGLQGQIADYTGLQTRVANLARDISGNVDSINTKYANLSQNDKIYDFTTSTQINALDEDYSITPALLKDNAIYLEEQNNLKIVGTITLATVLMAAIFISR